MDRILAPVFVRLSNLKDWFKVVVKLFILHNHTYLLVLEFIQCARDGEVSRRRGLKLQCIMHWIMQSSHGTVG
jgi:hypothetical protein